MNVRLWGWSGVVAAALVVGCKSDPTASLAGTPAVLTIVPKQFSLKVGDSLNVAVRILDQTFTSLQGTVTATAPAGGVVTVAPASNVKPDPTGTLSVFTVHGTSANATPLSILFSGGGLKDSAQVTVKP
jgi:hypothetical protein